MPEIKCSVIGLGKLGAPLAAILAKHYPTIGVDLNQHSVDLINQHKAPVPEPQLQEMLNTSTLTATTDVNLVINQSNVSFVIVPTPSMENGFFDNKYVLEAIAKIGAAIKSKGTYHLVNITSTVMPGSMRGQIKQALEAAVGRRVGKNLGLTYNPEFIALGDVINGIEKPDMILIGEIEPHSNAGDILVELYSKVCSGQPKLVRTGFENAEMAKLSLNTFLTLKIAYANTLGEICHNLTAANAIEVSRIIGLDSRISPKFLAAGMPFGGPCLPRDTLAFSALGKSLGVRASIVDASTSMNEAHVQWLLDKICSQVCRTDKIAILGLSYKPGTDVIEASTGVELAVKLTQRGFKVLAFDPLVKSVAKADFISSGVEIQTDLETCTLKSDILVITTAAKEFKTLQDIEKQAEKFPYLVFDGCRMFQQGDLGNAAIWHVGDNPQSQNVRKRVKLTT
jgi:UDPglucose 6-dehydrogenase